MATITQSKDARAAMREAAREQLLQHIATAKSSELAIQLAGTSDRKSKAYKSAQRSVNRWKAKLAGTSSQKRKPKDTSLKPFARAVPTFTLSITADYATGGDKKYLRKGKHMENIDFDEDDARDFLEHALDDPDEAYEDFFNEYALPPGSMEHPTFRFS